MGLLHDIGSRIFGGRAIRSQIVGNAAGTIEAKPSALPAAVSMNGEHVLATAAALEQLATLPASSEQASVDALNHVVSTPLPSPAHVNASTNGAAARPVPGESSLLHDVLSKAPRALETLPQIHQQTQRLIELMMDQSQAAGRLSQHTTAELRRLADTMNRQTELLTTLQSQLEQRSSDSAHIQASLDAFRATVSNLAESSMRAANILADMSRVSEHREERLMHLLSRTRTWFILAAVLSALACVGAVFTAGRGVWW